MNNFKIFVGYDPKEVVAWHVLVESLINQSSIPLCIVPLNLQNLNGIYKRKHDERQSNAFSFSRFLVPFLSNFEGIALYMDCDMLVQADIKELLEVALKNQDKAIHVVKHDYEPKNDTKYLGQKQYSYPRKNWSSVILWNCSHPSHKLLNEDYVATAEAATLHRFLWLDDDQIGELGVEWNWLVGEYDEDSQIIVKNVHWTVGGPYFEEYKTSDFSEEWRQVYDRTISCEQLKKS